MWCLICGEHVICLKSTLKKIFYCVEKFYLNPNNGDVYDYKSKVIIGKKINNEEIVFDDGEDH